MQSSKEQQEEIRKPFFSDQYKEIEEKNRMGKTRDLLKKNQRYQENISCKDGAIKESNGMDLTEAKT